MSAVLELSWWQLGLAVLLVGLVAVISLRQALGLERDLAIGVVRTIVQLYLVGLVLAAVFSAARWYWVLLILAIMIAMATHAAVARLARPIPGASTESRPRRSASRRPPRSPTSSASWCSHVPGGSRNI